MKINFKKVATVLGSALMLGSTAAFAAAASFTPSSFTDGGIALVVGQNAASSDLKAAVDLTANLAPATTTAAVSTTTVTGGDSYKIEKTSNKFSFGEGILDVDSSDLDKKDLPTLLADGTYLDSKNDEFEYKQTISLANLSLGLFDEDAYARDTPTVGFDVPEGTSVLNYTLDFTDTVNWSNLQTTDLPILGKKYYVLSAVNSSGDATITLLDSAVSAEVAEGETVTVDGHEVSAKITSGSEVKLTIDGQTTNTLDETETQRLSDGSYVGIKDISYGSKETQVSSVEFSIGSGKLKLVDGDDVELNDDAIDNLAVTISNDGSAKLDKITLAWSAQEDSWITPTSEIEMPGFKAIKMAFSGMTYPKAEQIVVKADGDDNLVLSEFPLTGGVKETINLLYSNGSAFTIVGKDANNKLAVSTNGNETLTFTKNVDDYFAVTYISGEDAESYLVRATNWDDADYPDNTVDFEYFTSTGWKSLDTGVMATEEVTVGSDASFTVDRISNESSSATVVVTAGSGSSFHKLVSAEGLKVQLPYIRTKNVNVTTALATCENAVATMMSGYLGYNFTVVNNSAVSASCISFPNNYTINFTEENKDDAIAAGNSFQVTANLDSDSEVAISSVSGAGSAYEIGESKVYLSYVASVLNTEIKDDQSGDHESVTITYHGAESFADVFVTSPEATVTGGSTPATSVGVVTVYDNEVSSASGKNLIVIGGSCVNTVAAELLGGALCGDAFTAKTGIKSGEALIESFARSGKVALLVAGYEAADTTKAITYLSNNNVNTTVGSKMKVTSATTATAITA